MSGQPPSFYVLIGVSCLSMLVIALLILQVRIMKERARSDHEVFVFKLKAKEGQIEIIRGLVEKRGMAIQKCLGLLVYARDREKSIAWTRERLEKIARSNGISISTEKLQQLAKELDQEQNERAKS